jgi:peptidoglycan/LPS O-acetylase OafA/YrhL
MNTERRYDIDWLRVIAIGLLLIYHVAVTFQPWGLMIGFITNNENWEGLWKPMSMLNVWRIPILFFISGIGMYYSFKNRNWKQLLAERTRRIFIPFLFGFLVIAPAYTVIVQHYYQWKWQYYPNAGHLWFLGNIFLYVLLLLPIAKHLKNNPDAALANGLKKLAGSPLVLIVVVLSFIAETYLAKPALYELYAQTSHGFFLGLLAFFWGYCFALSGPSFWNMLAGYRWVLLVFAIALYTIRMLSIKLFPDNVHFPVETCLWIFTMFGFGYKYLNKPGKTLAYLSKAAYPTYILHMLWMGMASILIFPLNISVYAKFPAVLIITIAGSLLSYEFIVRRIKMIRPLFGLSDNNQIPGPVS